MSDEPRTAICHATPEDVFVRGESLTRDLIGKVSFTEMMVLHVLGRRPTPGECRAIDACLVTIMEHGLTPTVISARLTYTSAPEAMQGAVAAGLCSVGSLFVGTMEGCAQLLRRIVAAADGAAAAASVVEEFAQRGDRLPGFGHPLHKPDDPRTPALLAVAAEAGVKGAHAAALGELSAAVDAARGRHLTVNATGAIAAVLLDCGVPAEIVRGFALVSRAAGLVGHIREEQNHPTLRAIWGAGAAAVPYDATHAAPTRDDEETS